MKTTWSRLVLMAALAGLAVAGVRASREAPPISGRPVKRDDPAAREVPGPAERKKDFAALLEIAEEHMDRRGWFAAEEVARVLNVLEPKDRHARGIEDDASRASSSDAYANFIRTRRARRDSYDRDWSETPYEENPPPPPSHRLTRGQWCALLAWAPRPFSGEAPLPADLHRKRHDGREEILAIKAKLETLRLDVDFSEGTLYDIVDFIQEEARINIVISAEVRKAGIPDRAIAFTEKNAILGSVMDDLLLRYGLASTFENRVLLITTELVARGKPVLEVYDIRDLLADGIVSGDFLEDFIRGNFRSESWIEREGEVSVAATGNSRLTVLHVPEVQEQVRSFLASLRR